MAFPFDNNSDVSANIPLRKQGSKIVGRTHGNPMVIGVDLNVRTLEAHQTAAGRDDPVNGQHIRVEVHREPGNRGGRPEARYHFLHSGGFLRRAACLCHKEEQSAFILFGFAAIFFL